VPKQSIHVMAIVPTVVRVYVKAVWNVR
jgi:hypothetical protein